MASAMVSLSNSVVDDYYRRKVEMSQKDVKKSVAVVGSIVNDLVTQISKQDARFQRSIFYTGSYYQGLKICRADEFDISIPLAASEFLKSDESSGR